jgi:hypothetical protein
VLLTDKNQKLESRERLAHHYSQLTDEALRWHLHEGDLSALAQEVVREELERRGVTDAPLPRGKSPGQASGHRRMFGRLSIVALIALVAVNLPMAWIIYRTLAARYPETDDAGPGMLAEALWLPLIATSVLAYVAAAIVGAILKARWTWLQISLSYFAIYAVSLCLMLPAVARRIDLYLQ